MTSATWMSGSADQPRVPHRLPDASPAPTACTSPRSRSFRWLAVYPSKVSADHDQVYIAYHDFSASQIWVATSNDGGQVFGPSVNVYANDPNAGIQSFCN